MKEPEVSFSIDEDDWSDAPNQLSGSLKERKEEPLEFPPPFPTENELSFALEKQCKKEEVDDDDEFLGVFDQLRNDNISPLSPVEPKTEVIEDRVIISVENPDNLPLRDDFNDEAVRDDYSIRRHNRHSKLDELYFSSDHSLSTHAMEKSTPQCILCEKFPTTAYGYAYHLTHHHKYSLIANGIHLRCVCSAEVRSHIRTNHKCDGHQFTLVNLGRSARISPPCILCKKYPKTAHGYAIHLDNEHKSSLKATGIYLVCSCGFVVRSTKGGYNHSKECDSIHFTVHKVEDEVHSTSQCVLYEAPNQLPGSLKEPKEEPLEFPPSFPTENELSFALECKKEKVDDDEFLGVFDQSGIDYISPLSPVEPKTEVIEDRVIISVENPDELPFCDDYNDEAMLVDYNIRRHSRHSKHDELASSSDLSLSTHAIAKVPNLTFPIEPKEEQKEIKEEEMMDDFVIPNYYEFPMKPKEESVDLFQGYSDNNSIGVEEIMEENSIEKEGTEEEESVGKSKKIKKKRKSSSNRQELARKKRRKEKRNSTELECPECEYRTTNASSWVSHLKQSHSTSTTLAGVALLCHCGNESLSPTHRFYCDIAEFTVIRKRDGPIQRFGDAKTTPQCVQCNVFPKKINNYPEHLQRHHNSTLNMHGIYLKCSCGFEFYSRKESFCKEHAKKCDSNQFTLHKLDE